VYDILWPSYCATGCDNIFLASTEECHFASIFEVHVIFCCNTIAIKVVVIVVVVGIIIVVVVIIIIVAIIIIISSSSSSSNSNNSNNSIIIIISISIIIIIITKSSSRGKQKVTAGALSRESGRVRWLLVSAWLCL
jgi:hypothetical protein